MLATLGCGAKICRVWVRSGARSRWGSVDGFGVGNSGRESGYGDTDTMTQTGRARWISRDDGDTIKAAGRRAFLDVGSLFVPKTSRRCIRALADESRERRGDEHTRFRFSG